MRCSDIRRGDETDTLSRGSGIVIGKIGIGEGRGIVETHEEIEDAHPGAGSRIGKVQRTGLSRHADWRLPNNDLRGVMSGSLGTEAQDFAMRSDRERISTDREDIGPAKVIRDALTWAGCNCGRYD